MLPLLLLIGGWFLLQQGVKTKGSDWLPIKYVRIEGAFQYIIMSKVKAALEGQFEQGFYLVNLQQVKQLVNQLPWVKAVHVKRIWPDTIEIQLTEHIPIVRWGEYGLLNQDGEPFIPYNRKEFSSLLKLTAPEGQERKFLAIMYDLFATLKKHNMTMNEFYVSERRAWSIMLDNNMRLLLGKNEPLERLQRFLRSFYLIGEQQIAQISQVDLRYPNGYALTWKDSEQLIDWAQIADKNSGKAN